jgi:uncharacterized protein (TIGR03437 family)
MYTACGSYSPNSVRNPHRERGSPDSTTGDNDHFRNGRSSATISLSPMSDQPHIVATCDVNVSSSAPGSLCVPEVTHGDGSLVTPDHPAHTGEELVLYAFGLGSTVPRLAAGEVSTVPAQPVVDTFTLTTEAAIPTIPSEHQSFAPLFAGLTPGFAGLYQVNFLAPAVILKSLVRTSGRT